MKTFFTPLFTIMILSGLIISRPLCAQTTDTLHYEAFNYPVGALPQGWTLDGAQAPWSVNQSQMAGGSAPELMLGYSFASGLSRLISPVVDITGYRNLKIRYNQYLVNYEADAGEIIGLDVTFDGGATWQTLWQRLLGVTSIPPDPVEFYFIAPEGATQVQYAYRFEGNNNFINLWLIDDVTIETVVDNDLQALKMSGTNTPVEGAESMYTVEILNGGNLTQSDYTVKLIKEGGVVIGSVAGQAIAFAEKKYYNFNWTPAVGEAGNTSLYAIVEFGDDENSMNNVTGTMDIIVQPDNIAMVEIGDMFSPLNFLPYNYFNYYSMTQTLYFPDEIGLAGDTIIALGYTGQFDQDTDSVHLQIMLGETTATNLTDNWLDPSTLTMVYDGYMNFKKGMNPFYIPLDNSYTYTGKNLVVHSVKNLERQLFLTPTVCSIDTASQRSRCAEQDGEPFNPLVPPMWGYTVDYYPNITLFFATEPTGIENLNSPKVIVYPNPAHSTINVHSGKEIIEVQMLNSIGQIVYRETATGTNHQIKVNSFNRGVYFVQCVTAEGTDVKKIVIE
jgi:hypothetical protein